MAEGAEVREVVDVVFEIGDAVVFGGVLDEETFCWEVEGVEGFGAVAAAAVDEGAAGVVVRGPGADGLAGAGGEACGAEGGAVVEGEGCGAEGVGLGTGLRRHF